MTQRNLYTGRENIQPPKNILVRTHRLGNRDQQQRRNDERLALRLGLDERGGRRDWEAGFVEEVEEIGRFFAED